jgi:DNA-binding YbaB/EbfC family protein
MNPRRAVSHDVDINRRGSGKPSPGRSVQKPTGRRSTGGDGTGPSYTTLVPHDVMQFDPNKLAEMMKQAQEMQEKLQRELAEKIITGEAGGGMVRVVLNGMMEVKSVKIEKAAIDPSDPTLLEDLVRAAVSQAIGAAEEARMEHTRQMAGGLGIPGL